jgi:pyruvate dehydrogenase E1 component beta subunit
VKEFGPARVRFTPISESVVTGIGLGAAGSGFRPIVIATRPSGLTAG